MTRVPAGRRCTLSNPGPKDSASGSVLLRGPRRAGSPSWPGPQTRSRIRSRRLIEPGRIKPLADRAGHTFQQAQFQWLHDYHCLQRRAFLAQHLDPVGRRRTCRVASKTALSGFQKLLRPGVIPALDEGLQVAPRRNAVFAARPIANDADLVLCGVIPAAGPADVTDGLFNGRPGRGGIRPCGGLEFLAYRPLLAVTMSQKSSATQSLQIGPLVLTGDT